MNDSVDLPSRLLDTVAEVCSRQWTSLGGLGRALDRRDPRGYRNLVDPEALILASLVARKADPRLEERLGWWARVGVRHTSVQRMRTMVRSYPSSVVEAWGAFAAAAARHGGASWKAHADLAGASVVRERTHGELDEPSLAEDAALLLRLRMGFGVNAKADLLAFLIGSAERLPLSAAVIARELAYSESAVKRAAGEMARAHLIQELMGHPMTYSVDSKSWRSLLEIEEDPPRWRPLALVFPFVAHSLEWASDDGALGENLHASRARDLFETSRTDLERLGLRIARPERYVGEEFESAFLGLLSQVDDWMRQNL